jgi:uncharacterized membrane protein
MKMLYDIITIAVVMLILDYIYINHVIIPSGYSKMISNIQGSPLSLNLNGAIISYLALMFGLYYFIIMNECTILDAFLLGIVIYAVYDATNYATIKKWDPFVALIDSTWGGVLFATTTFLVYSFNGTTIHYY